MATAKKRRMQAPEGGLEASLGRVSQQINKWCSSNQKLVDGKPCLTWEGVHAACVATANAIGTPPGFTTAFFPAGTTQVSLAAPHQSCNVMVGHML